MDHDANIYALISELRNLLSAMNFHINKHGKKWYHDSVVIGVCGRICNEKNLSLNLYEILKDLDTFIFDHTTSDCILTFR